MYVNVLKCNSCKENSKTIYASAWKADENRRVYVWEVNVIAMLWLFFCFVFPAVLGSRRTKCLNDSHTVHKSRVSCSRFHNKTELAVSWTPPPNNDSSVENWATVTRHSSFVVQSACWSGVHRATKESRTVVCNKLLFHLSRIRQIRAKEQGLD